MLQVRFNSADELIRKLPADQQEKITAEFIAIRKSAGVLDGNQLEAPSAGVTVRVSSGQTHVTEGPPTEAGAGVNGYYIYDAPDLDEAIAFAARIPVARMGGTIEVRALMER
jgi:hypothetical protein